MEDSKESRLRAEVLKMRADAERWHDEETLGDSTCEHRELEIHAYMAGYRAASASRSEILEALEALTNSAEEVEHDCYLLHGHEHFSPREWLETARALLAKYQGE